MQSSASFILNWFCAINEIILWKKKLNSNLWGEAEQKNFNMQSSKSNNRIEVFGRSTSGWP